MNFVPWRKIGQYATLLFCGVIILRYSLGHREELERVLHLRYTDVAIMTALGILIHILMGYKMLLVLRRLGLKDIVYLSWLKIFSVSRFLNFHLLQGGNIYRGIRLKQYYAFSYTDSFGMMAIFTWFDAVFILSVALLMVIGLDKELSLMGINAMIPLAILLIILVVGPFVCRNIFKQLQSRNPRIAWLYGKLTYLTDSLASNIRDRQVLIPLSLLSVGIFILFVWQISVAFKSTGTAMGLAEVAVFAAITLLSGVINITPSNIGVIEVTYGYLSLILGKTMGSGIIACGILRILGYIIVLFFTVISSRLLASQQNKTKHNKEYPRDS